MPELETAPVDERGALTVVAHHPIYLFRHGETVWNAEKRAQGHLDSPLTEAGRAQ
ncbi:MAG TPA: histidine phosphatase family protein, partial [Sphingomicrobium sp.]|nr:histidine phosphatase family protein [Sphingomicrobium sp.]